MKRRILSVFLAVLFISAGLFSAYRVFHRFRGSMISQHEEKLDAIATSVDRSIQSHLQIHRENLAYTISGQALSVGSLTNRDPHIRTILVISQGPVIHSTNDQTNYLLPDVLSSEYICVRNPRVLRLF